MIKEDVQILYFLNLFIKKGQDLIMLVSVIVPVYNVEKYLPECLDSLLKQSYTNIEVIMVDDGSKDKSGKICDFYATNYENFYVIHKVNAGLGMARNTGLEKIHGDYVTFLDADDYLDSDMIGILVGIIKEKKTDVCKTGFRRVDDNKSVIKEIKYVNQIFENDKVRLELLPRMIGSKPDCKDSIEMAVCAVLYNVEPIRKYNIRFPSERQLISEDLVFNIEYMQYVNKACTLEYIGYNYRYNPESLSTKYRSDRFDASKYFYLEIRKKLENLNYDRITMLRADRMFFIYTRMSIIQERRCISGKKWRKSLTAIKKICNDKILRNAIKNYPISKLGFRQKIFLLLIWYKLSYILIFLNEKEKF